jgi:hypothetical protein
MCRAKVKADHSQALVDGAQGFVGIFSFPTPVRGKMGHGECVIYFYTDFTAL